MMPIHPFWDLVVKENQIGSISNYMHSDSNFIFPSRLGMSNDEIIFL